jgi:hypothetical protein
VESVFEVLLRGRVFGVSCAVLLRVVIVFIF